MHGVIALILDEAQSDKLETEIKYTMVQYITIA